MHDATGRTSGTGVRDPPTMTASRRKTQLELCPQAPSHKHQPSLIPRTSFSHTHNTMDPYDPPLDTARHLRYWQRCLRTLLPHHYTSMDSTRLSIGFFIICSIDLLTPPATPSSPSLPLLTPTDRARLRRWVLTCQHPLGGFTASPTHNLPPHLAAADGHANAHIGGTYFALLLLALLAPDDDAASAFAGVDRAGTLHWLRRLQRASDGSFGETVVDGAVAGGKDMRYSYLAAAVRWMLRGESLPDSHPDFVPDIDVPALVAHIRRGQTYDGGFAESAAHESHAGYGYCAVAALALLDRAQRLGGDDSAAMRMVEAGVPDRGKFVAWLASRQFAWEEEDDGGEEDGEDKDEEEDPETANFRLADLALANDAAGAVPQFIGFNGRCNKVADTCYTWWALGSLDVLFPASSSSATPSAAAADPAALQAQRRFLLEKTQHLIGGFGKYPGAPPDVGHACLGLAALAMMGDPGLKKLDASMCVSEESVVKIEKARAGLLRGVGGDTVVDGQVDGQIDGQAAGGRDLGQRLVDIATRMGGGRPEWLHAAVEA